MSQEEEFFHRENSRDYCCLLCDKDMDTLADDYFVCLNEYNLMCHDCLDELDKDWKKTFGYDSTNHENWVETCPECIQKSKIPK